MADVIPLPKPQRGMVIKGLTPRLPERGKIKIGIKGKAIRSKSGNEFQPPQKLDHFIVTTMERGADNNLLLDAEMHDRLGEKPTSIPVRLLYDDPTLNFPTRYACYRGKSLWCSGDGNTAQRLTRDGEYMTVECTCPLADPTRKLEPGETPCKMNGALSVLIDGASGIGGIWKFRTTSYNSIVGLLSTMSFLRQVTGGPLANIPLRLLLRGKQAANPRDGTPVHIFVVELEFAGDMEALQAAGHRIALARATTHLSIEHIEDEARRAILIAPKNTPLPGDESADEIVAEFYPEQADQDSARPARPTRDQFIEADPEPEKPFAVADADGQVHEFDDAGSAVDALRALLLAGQASRGEAGIEAAWEDNAALISALRESGLIDLADEMLDHYAALLFEARREPDPPATADAAGGDRLAASSPPAARPRPTPHPRACEPHGRIDCHEPECESPGLDLPPAAAKTDWELVSANLGAEAAKLQDQAAIDDFSDAHRDTLVAMRMVNKAAAQRVANELAGAEGRVFAKGRRA